MHECFCTFPSVILPNNVLSLRPERPHFHHFATKWNKFSTNKPAGPSLAVELSQSNAMSGGRWGWNQSYYYSPALQVCSPTSIFISRHSLIYFLQKMNSSPLTVNTRITKITNTEINYRARPRKSKCSLHLHAYCLRWRAETISLAETRDWTDTVLYWVLLFGVLWPWPIILLIKNSCFCKFIFTLVEIAASRFTFWQHFQLFMFETLKQLFQCLRDLITVTAEEELKCISSIRDD